MYRRFDKDKKINKYSERSIFNQIFGFVDEEEIYNEKNYNKFYREEKLIKDLNYKHYHEIEGFTSTTKEHIHEYKGRTIKKIGHDENHIHIFKIETSMVNGHTHKIYIKTGPTINSEYVGHLHLIDGMTTVDNGHAHFFGAYCSENIIR